MNHFRTSSTGFTGKEFLVVMLVIFGLCVVVVPLFNAMKSARLEKQARSVVRVVQANIEKHKSISSETVPQTQYPQVLDDQPSNRQCITCFNAVLKKGISSPLWFKISDTEYAFSRNGNFGDTEKYTEKGDLRVVYDLGTGKLRVERIE